MTMTATTEVKHVPTDLFIACALTLSNMSDYAKPHIITAYDILRTDMDVVTVGQVAKLALALQIEYIESLDEITAG